MTSRAEAFDLASEFLKRFSSMDFVGASELLAEDVAFDSPYSANPVVTRGRDAFVSRMTASVTGFVKQIQFTINEAIFDPERGVIVVDFRNDGIRLNGSAYHNHYVGVFDIADGKISRWRQFFNPSLL